MTHTVGINRDRLWACLMELKKTGAYDDQATGLHGVRRLALTDADAHERRPIPHAYIECHIEQGPILADAGVDIGIVEGVQSISWQRLTLWGEAAHAGTTSISSRHDAGLAAASVVVEARRMCDSGDFGQLRRRPLRIAIFVDQLSADALHQIV